MPSAARASTYSVSEAAGSLVPVLAQSRRYGRAPARSSFLQRSEQLAIGFVGARGDRDAESVVLANVVLVFDEPCPEASVSNRCHEAATQFRPKRATVRSRNLRDSYSVNWQSLQAIATLRFTDSRAFMKTSNDDGMKRRTILHLRQPAPNLALRTASRHHSPKAATRISSRTALCGLRTDPAGIFA